MMFFRDVLKRWHKSKTIWFGHALAIVGLIEANIHLLRDHLGEYYGYAFIFVAIITYILRAKTNTALKDK